MGIGGHAVVPAPAAATQPPTQAGTVAAARPRRHDDDAARVADGTHTPGTRPHIEAGMRSGRWRDPFPEEIIRRATSQVATIHFAPGETAVANLRAARVRGSIVNTFENTIRDSLDLAAATAPVDGPGEGFGLVSIHPFELLERPERLRPIVELLSDVARRQPMQFVDHPVTAEAVRAAGLDGMFHDGFRRIPRQRYFSFIALLQRSRSLVTDSGGSQEECAYLGLPCLVHRAVTEHATGLDGSVKLSRLDLDVVRTFLEEPDHWRREPNHSSTARRTWFSTTSLKGF